jgi:hypothetical protein
MPFVAYAKHFVGIIEPFFLTPPLFTTLALQLGYRNEKLP